jgi:electron transfer flavoprotein beta subunit
MKIIVCIKQVPDTETKVRIASDGASLAEADVNWIVSPYDEFAIEEALRQKEKAGGEVVLMALGPDRVATALRTGLAMGADSAVHLKVEAADTLGTARALAAAIRKAGAADLVLTGQQGVGGDHSQIPGLLAELLDLPQVTTVVKLEVADGKVRAEREVDGGKETWEASLPAVISAQKGLNEPRYASLKGIMAAKKKPIEAWDAGALGLGEADLQPQTRVSKLELPPARAAVKMIEGDADTQVRELLRLLHEEAKVI